MLEVMISTSVLFASILLGFLCGKFKLFTIGADTILIKFVFYISLPLSLFISCYKTPLVILDYQYIIAYIISMLLIITITYLYSRKYFKLDKMSSVINTLATSQVDGAYFTIPLFMFVFSSAALAIPLQLVMNLVFFTISLLVIDLLLVKDKSKNFLSHLYFIAKRIIVVIFTNPLIFFSMLGLALGLSNVVIPHKIQDFAGFMGRASSPVALFSLGLTCAFHLEIKSILKEINGLVIVNILKLIIFPIIALSVGIILHLSQTTLLALVLLCASPTATHTYIIANKYKMKSMMATFSVVTTTILSVITINIWLYLLHH